MIPNHTLPFTIRQADPADVPALLEIYRPFVETTAVSFELVTPSAEEFAARISKALAGWDWLVADRDGQPVGYAYATSHRQRAAYRYSVEVSAYVHPDYRRQGTARALYLRLFDSLAGKGYCNAYAAVRVPNDASVAFHCSLGFEPIGVFKRAGWKFGTDWRTGAPAIARRLRHGVRTRRNERPARAARPARPVAATGHHRDRHPAGRHGVRPPARRPGGVQRPAHRRL